jgi:hypothetical protein
MFPNVNKPAQKITILVGFLVSYIQKLFHVVFRFGASFCKKGQMDVMSKRITIKKEINGD